jgi:hypothetical protein
MFLQEMTERVNKLKTEDLVDVPCTEKMEAREAVVAEMTDLHRRLYTVAYQYKNEFRQLKSTMLQMQAKIINEEADDKKSDERVSTELNQINLSMNLCLDKKAAIMGVFWAVIHEDFDPLLPPGAGGLYIREGNKITFYSSTDARPEMPNFFKGMFGA